MWVQKKRRSTVPSTASWEIREPLRSQQRMNTISPPFTSPRGGAAPVVQGGQDRQLAGQVQHPAQQQPEKQDQGKGDQEEEHPGQLQGQIIRHRPGGGGSDLHHPILDGVLDGLDKVLVQAGGLKGVQDLVQGELGEPVLLAFLALFPAEGVRKGRGAERPRRSQAGGAPHGSVPPAPE